MLPKKRRISRKEFGYIMTHSKRYVSPHLILYVSQYGQDNPSRFSFSISKKVNKKASDRNTCRRRGYSAVASMLNLVHPGYMCFFSFKNGRYPVSFGDLNEEISGLLRSAAVIV